MAYEIGLYRDSSGKNRWAVWSKAANVWYFPNQYGKRAAQRLARNLNKG